MSEDRDLLRVAVRQLQKAARIVQDRFITHPKEDSHEEVDKKIEEAFEAIRVAWRQMERYRNGVSP